VCTKLPCIPPGPSASFCKVIGDFTGLITAAETGSTLPTEYLPTLVSQCSRTPEIPTASISSQLNPTSFAARATVACAFIEPETAAPRGSLLSAACRKSAPMKPFCAMPSPRTYSTAWEFTSVHAVGSCLARAMKDEHGKKYWKACRQWSAFAVQSSRTHPASQCRAGPKPHPRPHLQQRRARKASRGGAKR